MISEQWSFALRTAGRALWIAAGVILLLAALPAAAEPKKDAGAFVQSLSDRVLEVISNDAKSAAEKRTALRRVFSDSFDAPRIGRFVLGRYWRSATESQRAAFMKLFPEYVAEIYATQFSSYSGETFVVIRSTPIDAQQSLVAAEIRRPRGPPTKVNFRIDQGRSRYVVIDVTVEGASLIVTKRGEFAALIRRKGFDELLDRMRQITGQKTSRLPDDAAALARVRS